MFGYKNHVGIDRRHGFARRFRVTDAAAADGRRLGAELDPDNLASGVWADTAYRSRANLELPERRGLKAACCMDGRGCQGAGVAVGRRPVSAPVRCHAPQSQCRPPSPHPPTQAAHDDLAGA